MSGPDDEPTPAHLREGVRTGILAGLERDLERRGGRTARRLLAAGAIGVLGALGVTLLLSGHPYGHHPPWHAVFFGALWTGLLVVAVSLVLLDVRTPSLSVGRAAGVGVIGLGIAGVCGALCPDPHFLHWWSATRPGRWLVETGGVATAALCFGAVTALVYGAGASVLGLRGDGGRALRPLLPAAMLLALLVPGIALQAIGTSWAVFWSWLLGSAAGSWVGVAGAVRLRSSRPRA